MKKLFFLTMLLVAGVAGAQAQGEKTATLQQGSSLKVYYGDDAFKEAYAEAKNGATITLSAGSFNQVDSITKSISIIGSGGFPVGEQTSFNYVDRKNENFPGQKYATITSDMLINANNVSVEGVYMDHAVILRNISGLRLTHCYIHYLYCNGTHTNSIIDQCYMKEDCSERNSVNCCVKNSFVEGFHSMSYSFDDGNDVDPSLCILNSVVFRSHYCIYNNSKWDYYHTIYKCTAKNSILGRFTFYDWGVNNPSEARWNGYDLRGAQPPTSSKNLLFLYPYHYKGSSGYELVEYLKSYTAQLSEEQIATGSTSAAYDAIFNQDVQWYDPNYLKTTELGDDGKVVGPYGGTGFSLYPSIPRITESKIDTYTDGDGKLNVKVKVEVNQ